MKKLTYKNRKFLYKIKEHDCGDYGAFICYETEFYDAVPIVKTKKKYWLFGPKILYNKYNKLFSLWCNIESPGKTKKQIQKLLDKQIDLLNRIDEINNNKIV